MLLLLALNLREIGKDSYEWKDNCVVIKNTKKSIDLNLKKIDMTGTKNLSGAVIKLWDNDSGRTLINGLSKLNGYENDSWGFTSNSDGTFGKVIITPADFNSGSVIIKLKELKAPDGYALLNGGNEVKLKITYDPNTCKIKNVSFVENASLENYISYSNSDITMNLKNNSVRIIYHFEGVL